jgi:hypothetical protein
MINLPKNADGQLAVLADGRQSPIALEIQRGVVRLLTSHAIACVPEFSLPNQRRADLITLSGDGEVWIVEIKSCPNDFRTDNKWLEYQDYCDRLFFAVRPDFPTEVLPSDAGLILADNYGGEIVRKTDAGRLAAARRKAITLRFARAAAVRLSALHDPKLAQFGGIIEPGAKNG